jgi:hypothetical protein
MLIFQRLVRYIFNDGYYNRKSLNGVGICIDKYIIPEWDHYSGHYPSIVIKNRNIKIEIDIKPHILFIAISYLKKGSGPAYMIRFKNNKVDCFYGKISLDVIKNIFSAFKSRLPKQYKNRIMNINELCIMIYLQDYVRFPIYNV